ncbi:MAG: DUF359 domain-containing protein [Nitrososphaerota archaeon]|nr:DUF359 domain-containing protein [Nitrososphaerota archaeon]MDG6955926.1 DUF359 domain-containing protein [Nitrososphaerota archaeon]MDG6957690.1 DUF359 domain-containing protein [Nitrososphaerota archaeon]MDG6959063.1 DUF359 domain-containing protein [Nitrososphaerota archaeon]MDG6965172.1 DUF359 domain-containing protein [Nitrososphaerota archaeon]
MAGPFRLPESLRSKLAEPLGRVFGPEEARGKELAKLAREASMVVTVGDRVTETLHALDATPAVHVVDGVERRSRREPPDVPYARLVKVSNPAGTLTQGAIDGMREAFAGSKPVRVLVDGEEDLMALLAVAMAPISAIVFYGQPGVGIVAVVVNGVSKARNRALLAEMGIERL